MRLQFGPALILSAVVALSAQTSSPQVLRAGVAVNDTLAAGETRVYQIALEQGDFAIVSVKKTIYLPVVEVFDPAGGLLLPNFPWPEPSIVAAISGVYRVRLSSNPASLPAGAIQTVVEVRRATPQDRNRADADRAMAEGRARYGDSVQAGVKAAFERYSAAIELYRNVSYQPGEALALMLRGAMNIDLKNQQAARDDLNLAVRVAHQVNAIKTEAIALQYLGSSHSATSEFDASLRYAEQALSLYEKIGDLDGQSGVLNNIARVYRLQNENRMSLDAYDRALQVSLAAGDNDSTGLIYVNRGDVFLALGQLPQALESLTLAAPFVKAAGRESLEMVRLNNIGIVYKQLGDYRKALEIYEQALAGYRRLGNALAEAQVLNNIGNAYQFLEEYPAALDQYGQSLAISRRINQRAPEMASLTYMGTTFQKQGDYARALEYHQQVLAMRRAAGDRSGEAIALNQSGIDWHGLGDLDKAADALHQALDIRREFGEQSGEAETLLNLAAVERDRGDPATARTTIEDALKMTEAVRAGITDANLRASYVARVESTYASYVDILMRLHQQAPAAGHDREGLQAADRARARVLLESLDEARANLREGVDRAVLDAEASAKRALDAASAGVSKLLAQHSSDAEIAAARRTLDRADAAYQQVQAQIRASSPRYAALTQPQPLTADQIQREIDNDTVLLEFALGDARSWLWAVTPQAIASVQLPPQREITAAVRAFNDEVSARQRKTGESAAAYASRVAQADRNLPARAAALSRLIFGGIATQLAGPWQSKRLAIVASGALEYVPFAALPLPGTTVNSTGVPLIAGHEIIEIPSTSVLATLRRDTANRPQPRHTLAMLADPVFEVSDPRVSVKSLASSSTTDAGLSYSAERAVARIDAERGGPLTRLPFSRAEAEAIGAIAGRADTLSALDFRASRATALSAALADYRIVHFATHGLIDTERPDLSGLVLSLVNDRGIAQDGFLRLTDIYNLRLQADLVVLSACQTALGKEIRGEGLVGLTRGFMYAGTPRVVASLWEVSDLATAELMKRFYAGMLQQKLAPAAALRAAQRQLSRDPRWASPYFWAGFVFEGDWK